MSGDAITRDVLADSQDWEARARAAEATLAAIVSRIRDTAKPAKLIAPDGPQYVVVSGDILDIIGSEEAARPRAKLVRDRIPEIIRAGGSVPVITVADPGDMPGLLRDKLAEETAEYAAARNLEELADVLEVLCALAACHGLDAAGLERIRAAKAAERGGFGCRYVWRGNEEKAS